MAFQFDESQDSGMNEINLIPLIDVMLVLMIIFLVTATVLNPSVPLQLPKTSAEVLDQQPPKVMTVSIVKDGSFYLDEKKVSLSELYEKLHQAAMAKQKPSIQLRADRESRYNELAQVLSYANQAGLNDIAFVSLKQ